MKYVYGSILFALGIVVGVSAQHSMGTTVHAQTKPLPDVSTALWQTADTLGAIGASFGLEEVIFASEDAKNAALSLTVEQVEVLMPSRVAMAHLSHKAQALAAILEEELGDSLSSLDGDAKSSGLPSAPYSSICGSGRLSSDALLAALEVFLAAEIVREEALRGCQQTAVTPAGGGNTSLACIATDVVYFAAKAVYENLVFCEGDIDSAEIKGSYDRAGHIHDDIGGLDTKLDRIIELVLANAEAIEKNRLAICDAKRLITTPSGQRESNCETCSDQPGYPYAWPEGQGNGNANTNTTTAPTTTDSRSLLSRLFPRWF